MQIHDLGTLGSAPASTDVLPIDTGSLTAKITIDELAAAMKPTWHGLLNAASVASGGTVELSDSMANYGTILFRWNVLSGSNWWTRASGIFPSGTASFRYELSYVDSTNVQRWCGIERVDNTHIKITSSANASGQLYIYGLRLM